MIMRPPQQGQGFRSSSACPPSVLSTPIEIRVIPAKSLSV
jgi:hypothetical protein